MSISVRELEQRALGAYTTSARNPVGTTVNTTATRIALNDARRVNLKIINPDVNDVFLLDSDTVTVNGGIRLVSGGGNLELLWDEDGDLVTHEWWAIAVTAATTYISEETFIQM